MGASFFMPQNAFSQTDLQQLKQRYNALQSKLADLPWILQGTVVERPPPSDSTTARPTYMWTRKVRGKTVTVSLSRRQFQAFRQAIKANRQIEETLKAMRVLSQTALLNSLPGAKRIQRRKKGQERPAETS
jgi:hypothetical protein